jgi:hypothetical protein
MAAQADASQGFGLGVDELKTFDVPVDSEHK